VDRIGHEARANGQQLDLTPKEFSLLEHLLLHADQIVTRTTLLEKVWDLHFDPGSNVVDVHMARLRTKLRRSRAKAGVTTVRGIGYRLTPGSAEAS
jgi:two-component system OmpR family response regulator